MPLISACIITLNEEDNIERALKSLSFTDEIILLDSGSTDKTLELANKFASVKIFHREFDNYINQKNHCISLAKNDWVLVIDADEEISEELRKEIISRNDYENSSGYYFPRQTFYLQKWIRHGGWYPNYQLKFFNKNKGRFSGMLVHERVDIDGNCFYLKSPLLHYSYKNISDHIRFIDRYSSLAAEEKFQNGKSSSILWSIGKGFYKFINMYFVKLGILDGQAGLVIAVLGGFYNFLKYIKLYELNKNKNNKKL